MSRFIFCFFFISLSCFGQTKSTISGKNVLLVWGGWEGHQPELFTEIVTEWLYKENANFQVIEGLGAYDDLEKLMEYDSDMVIMNMWYKLVENQRANYEILAKFLIHNLSSLMMKLKSQSQPQKQSIRGSQSQ